MCPKLHEVGLLDFEVTTSTKVRSYVPKRYIEAFRRKVFDLVATGRPIAQIAAVLNS